MTPAPAPDRLREQAFCSPKAPEVFHSIVQPDQIWRPDPFDVDTIHRPAREMFERLLHRARYPENFAGRILLLLGESGSGKTHLMRAFRAITHANDRGYFSYFQMTSNVSNYSRYVLDKLLDSLDKPYRSPDVETSGLMRLAMGVLESQGVGPRDCERFREGDVLDLGRAVDSYADQIVSGGWLGDCDIDVIRALLFLQRSDPGIRKRVLKWLRCEDLSPRDRELLGGLVPRPHEHEPQRMIGELGRIMAALHAMPLVLCVDQLEDMADSQSRDGFRQVINTLVAIGELVPSSVVVISCLEDFFTDQRPHLPKPKLDRLELDPEPIRLTTQRGLEEIEALIARRLQHLYDEMNVSLDENNPTFPFSKAQLQLLANLRTRDILHFCSHHRQRCVVAGRWIEEDPPPLLPASPTSLEMEQLWNDFGVTCKEVTPEDESSSAQLMAWAIKACSDEVQGGYTFDADPKDSMVNVRLTAPDGTVELLLVAFCDEEARGGGLSRQIMEVEEQARGIRPVIVRSTEFPAKPTAQVNVQLGKLIARGGRKAQMEDSDWREISALRSFQAQHGQDPRFRRWRQAGQPLTQIASLRKILDLDQWIRPAPGFDVSKPAAPPEEHPVVTPTSTVKPVVHGPLTVGTRRDVADRKVELAPQELCYHAAFLGGAGSGKTTAALNLIEQLLERGVPAVLLDRKGDLSSYKDPAAWQASPGDPQLERRKRLREQVDIVLYTPGEPNGRLLNIPLMPDGADRLPTLERQQLANYAAMALGGMMGLKNRGNEAAQLAILKKAIEVQASAPGKVTVKSVQRLVDERDDALLAAVGGFDERRYKRLSENLLALWLQRGQLLDGSAESLDIDVLLGRSAANTGKTRLSIISTRSLGDAATVEFWVAQFLATLVRWTGKRPSSELQAVFLFDEADKYLPAGRQSATKEPMENLLRRASSAGIGLMLATQSPGDLDYRCRDNIRAWFVGRVKEATALVKLKPMLSDCKVDVSGKLAGQETAQFYLLKEREVVALQTPLSLVKTEQLPEERIAALAREDLSHRRDRPGV